MEPSFRITGVAVTRIGSLRRWGCKLAYGGTGPYPLPPVRDGRTPSPPDASAHGAYWGGLAPRLERSFLRHAAGSQHLVGDVEAHAEVVDEVEKREGPEDGIWIRHLDEDRDVAEQPERGERQGKPTEGACARRVNVPDGYEDQERAEEQYRADRGCSEVEDDEVERRYIPVAREAQEEVICLGAVACLG